MQWALYLPVCHDGIPFFRMVCLSVFGRRSETAFFFINVAQSTTNRWEKLAAIRRKYLSSRSRSSGREVTSHSLQEVKESRKTNLGACSPELERWVSEVIGPQPQIAPKKH